MQADDSSSQAPVKFYVHSTGCCHRRGSLFLLLLREQAVMSRAAGCSKCNPWQWLLCWCMSALVNVLLVLALCEGHVTRRVHQPLLSPRHQKACHPLTGCSLSLCDDYTYNFTQQLPHDALEMDVHVKCGPAQIKACMCQNMGSMPE
jgi:hypothetical protein